MPGVSDHGRGAGTRLSPRIQTPRPLGEGVSRLVQSGAAPHAISPKTVAPETGVLLHFKLLHDLHAKARDEAARGEYSRGALEYRRYARTLDQNPRTTFMYEGSVRFESTNQLVRLGLMQDGKAWRAARGEVSAQSEQLPERCGC